jgi:hypothetical protein
MIDLEKLEKPYEKYTIRSMIPLICDYCGCSFTRVKKSIERLNANCKKDSCGSKECTKLKKNDVNVNLFGSNDYFTSETFKEKQKETNLQKFGVEEYFDSDDFKNKRKETLIERYGVDSPLKNESIKEKQKQTSLERYGFENYAQTEEYKEKIKLIDIDYDKLIEKRDQTSLEKYGVTSYSKTDEHKERKKETCLNKYGFDHSSKSESNRQLAKDTCVEKYGVTNYSKTDEFKEKYKNTCMERYGVPNVLMLAKNRIYGKVETELKDYINSFGFNFKKDFSVLNGKELDLYDENKNVAFEYCGLYWHNELSSLKKDKGYHYFKYKTCEDKGIHLITMFSDEWDYRKNQCKNYIESVLGIYDAEIFVYNCEIKEIDRQTCYNFCYMFDIQFDTLKCEVGFGLFHNNELISVISLCSSTDKKSIILNSISVKSGFKIIDETNQLFKCCVNWAKLNNYKNIVAYSDNRWSINNIYKYLNFQLDEEMQPNYDYVNLKDCRKRLSKQFVENCIKDETETKLARIWNCGKTRWNYPIVMMPGSPNL